MSNELTTEAPLQTVPGLAVRWGLSQDVLRRVLRSRLDLWTLGARVGTARVFGADDVRVLRAAVNEYLTRPHAQRARQT